MTKETKWKYRKIEKRLGCGVWINKQLKQMNNEISNSKKLVRERFSGSQIRSTKKKLVDMGYCWSGTLIPCTQGIRYVVLPIHLRVHDKFVLTLVELKKKYVYCTCVCILT
ncbi:hypothetical protein HELRODRAFT_159833 [Helobdella robusta]|uniref:Uncharacterized protein n=1 Tax=Helobdella robusta TaxID=6412 RepID=T1EPG5_HELRO|nr:hypothetical protein HELRODRAFT_159833 [Helobdella robusta]ESO13200.1 hypothetical protein HELRODRAFT_159833 [Helobdella robusta]